MGFLVHCYSAQLLGYLLVLYGFPFVRPKMAGDNRSVFCLNSSPMSISSNIQINCAFEFNVKTNLTSAAVAQVQQIEALAEHSPFPNAWLVRMGEQQATWKGCAFHV